MAKTSVQCKTCDTAFLAENKELKRGMGKYCTRSCSASDPRRKLPPNTACSWCGTPFRATSKRKKASKSGLLFCKRACKDAAQRIGGLSEIQPGHYGTGTSRYRALALKHLPNCCAECGWSVLGNVLEVHHIDQDRTNNDLSNLEILCPTCHVTAHFLEGSGRWRRSKRTPTSPPHL